MPKKNIEKIYRICEKSIEDAVFFCACGTDIHVFGSKLEKMEKTVEKHVTIRAILYHFSPIYAFLTGF